MKDHLDPIDGYRRQTLMSVYGHLLTAAHRVRKRYGASFTDPDLTVEDLSQIGAMKMVECYDWLMAKDVELYLSLQPEDLQQLLIVHATRSMAWHVIDTYRQRDRRREAIAPDELLRLVDETQVERVVLWRRVEGLMPSLSQRQRRLVQAMWDGLDTESIGHRLKVSPNVVQKDLAAIRSLAA